MPEPQCPAASTPIVSAPAASPPATFPVRSLVRSLAFAAVAIAAGLTLSGCSGSGSTNPFDDHEERSEYSTGAEAKKDRASMPRWLPDDAQDIKYVLSTTGDDRLLAATFHAGKLPGGCATGTGQGKPKLTADWLPEKLASKADTRCGTWSGATVDGTFYAWQDHAVVQASRPKN
ncbi:hypothetical protein [Streptomyces sp. NPDC093589]|uniref:hypothetical protein n=1 Tax=Streptomyces sp. NPDC093589 TaxID=3366043 RepID=UPI0037F95A25